MGSRAAARASPAAERSAAGPLLEVKGGLETPEVSSPYAQGDMRDDELWQRGRAAWKRHQGALVLAGVVATCVVLLRTWVVQPRLIASDSMLPTLMRGDRVVVDQLS